MVTNPCSLFSSIPPDTLYFTVLDLKDDLFTIPLHHSSQPLFAFTWMGPDTYQSQQLTWTILPQGFRDSPHFFSQALQRDLQTLDLGSTATAAAAKLLQLCLTLCDPTDGSPPGSTIPGILQARTLEWVAISFSTTLLQHVDDLLLCSSSCHNYLVHTATVLNALGNWDYTVSFSKTQTASTTVHYMGLLLTPTSKIIPAQRLRALTQIPKLQTKRELLSLLGLLNFFQIWVPNFALHAKPL